MQKLDSKFYGRIFREKDNTEVPCDQFMVFLARDAALIPTLQFYREECLKLGCAQPQIDAIGDLIDRARAWQAANPGRLKLADVDPGELQLQPKSLQPLTFEAAIKTVKDCAMYYGRGSEQFPGCEAAVNSLEGELARWHKAQGLPEPVCVSKVISGEQS